MVWSRQQYRASRWNEPKDPLFFLSLCLCVFGWRFVLFGLFDCFVLFCFVLLGWLIMCLFYILFVHCTQSFHEIFQKTDPAMGFSVKTRESHVLQLS